MSFNAKGLTNPEPIAKYLLGFSFNSFKLISQNLFKEHTARSYLQGSAQKFKMIEFSITYMARIASTQLNTTPVIGWTRFINLLTFNKNSPIIAKDYYSN